MRGHTPYTDQRLEPGAWGSCSRCGEPIIAKCGNILAWHWAHLVAASEPSSPESMWHRDMQMWAESQGAETEVPIGRHRADIVWSDGSIWELQSTTLGPADIAARESEYGDRVTWVYRIRQDQFDRLWNIGGMWFRWDRPTLRMLEHQRPVVWHHQDRFYDVTFRREDGEVHCHFVQHDELVFSRPAPFHLDDAGRWTA